MYSVLFVIFTAMSLFQTKKQLSDEKNAPGSGFKKHKPKKPEDVKIVRQPSPEVTILDDDSSEEKKSDLDLGEMLDCSDFTCVTCRQIDSSANNQLFECIECHSLHHQLCHIPKISNEANLTSWICSACKTKKDKDGSSKSAKSYESSSSEASSSHSSKKPKITISSSERKSETSKKKSSSSSSSSRSRSSKK